MLQLLYDFYKPLFALMFDNGLELRDFEFEWTFFNGMAFTIDDYLALIASLVSLIVIIFLCCLFIKTLIKLVFRLFTLGGSL